VAFICLPIKHTQMITGIENGHMTPKGFKMADSRNFPNHLEKFDGKLDEGFFVGYSTNSKAFRAYNTRTRPVEENLHIKFLDNKPIIVDSDGDNKDNDGPSTESEIDNQERLNAENSTKDVNTIGPSINTASSNINTASLVVNTVRQSDDFFGADNDMRSLDRVGVDISNISTTYPIPTTPNTRIHKDHTLDNMDIKSAFLYGRIEEEVYVCQPLGFEDPNYPDKVYKVEKALSGLYQAPRACQDKYVDEILRKFKYEDVKIASTPIDKEKALLKDSDGNDVDVHLYRFMISDYARASLDRKSTSGGCQFLGCRLISWQCKKQTVVATSTTKAEYVAAASCCGQEAKSLELSSEDLSLSSQETKSLVTDSVSLEVKDFVP
nr:hypothetical protein [Tanacetum cinerariifolium]